MKHPLPRLFLPVALLISVSSAEAELPATVSPATDSLFLSSTWKIVSLNEEAITDRDKGEEERPNEFFFHNGRAGGTIGCNRLSGAMVQRGDSLRISTVISTMMYCEGVMEREQRLIRALGKISNWKRSDNGALLLLGEEEKVLLELRPSE